MSVTNIQSYLGVFQTLRQHCIFLISYRAILQVNMKTGLKTDRLKMARETCTACAGSMILEMATLSRLTGESVFELKAQKAMDELWKMRHRSSDLMGTVLNVHSGKYPYPS